MIAQHSEDTSGNRLGDHLIVYAVGITRREVPDTCSTSNEELVHGIKEAGYPEISEDKRIELLSYIISPCHITIRLSI